MKRKNILGIITAGFLSLSVVGCDDYNYTSEEISSGVESFTLLRSGYNFIIGTYYIICDNNTKVEYMVLKSNGKNAITPLYNEDGTIKIYQKQSVEESEKEEQTNASK